MPRYIGDADTVSVTRFADERAKSRRRVSFLAAAAPAPLRVIAASHLVRRFGVTHRKSDVDVYDVGER